MNIDIPFSQQHVVVFGGTSGINFGIAQAFARQGGNVSVMSRNPENVDRAVAALRSLGGKVFGAAVDARDFDAVGASLGSAAAELGEISTLVSGAAGNFLCEIKDMTFNGFRAIVDIDLVGTFNVIRQSFPFLKKPGASVINITAPQSAIPMRFQAHAGAAKAGVDQLTRVLALEWGAEGIRVNAISPGPVDGTEGLQRLMARTDQERAASQAFVPLKRFASLDDIANLALFLASPYASYISGAIIPCDGGGAIESVKPAVESAGASQRT